MESGSGMETEGVPGQDLLSYLGRELEDIGIVLGKWMEGASGKELETVRDLRKKHRKLSKKRRKLSEMGIDSGKVTEVDSDSGRNKITRMLRETNELRKEMMVFKDMEKQLLKEIGSESGKGMEIHSLLLKEIGSESGKGMEIHSLVKEIISVERERRDLLASLTPTVSLWKEIDSQATWTISRKEPPTSSSSWDNDAENQLADYFDLMLQDMEDLGHRMLSMLYFLNKSNGPICSYKATELCNTTAKLNMHISKGFSTNQEQDPGPEEEPGQINLSSLFRKYYRFPNNYVNTLAQLDMEEEGTKHEVKKTKEEEDKENDRFTIEYFKKTMEIDQDFFANDRKYWENGWASKLGRCGGFANTTILSPMQFTHYTPGTGSIPPPAAVTGSTLQIYSIKIKNLKGLNWPLKVYGKVAARDTVDRNRNILFSRPKFDYQELNGEDDSLCLTGPSRAIVAFGHVDFEVELKVIAEGESQRLIICRGRYGGTDDCSSSSASVIYGGDGPTFLLSNHLCTTEVTLEQLDRSHQATIVGIRVTKGDWSIKHGCRVICFWAPDSATDVIDTTCRPIVLLDDRGKEIHIGSGKYLHLSRRVVSVESHGILRVAIEAYGEPGQCIARKGHVDFPVKQCQTTAFDCVLGDTTLEVVVAWSLLIKDKADLQVLLS